MDTRKRFILMGMLLALATLAWEAGPAGAQLDPGGSFYLYLGTEQWLGGISDKVSAWRQLASTIPGWNAKERADLDRSFDVLVRLIKNSGVEEVSGLGVSGIAREPGFYRTKALLHHYRGKGAGFLWSAFGKTPHALAAQDLLPATTALAMVSDLDLPLVWSLIEKEVAQAGFPQAEAWLRSMPQLFEKAAGLNWAQFLASLGGEYGLVLTLDEARPIQVPVPSQQPLSIPEPALLLVVKVKDDLIFDRLDQLTRGNQQLVRVEKDGLKLRTMPMPVPLPITLRPSWARSGDYLLLASTDTIILDAVAVKQGQKPGLKSTDEFKRLAQNIPNQGNNFTFMSQRFGQTITRLQQQALAAGARSKSADTEWMRKLIDDNAVPVAYTVGANTDEGWLAVGNGSQQPAKAILAVSVVPLMGMMAAIAVPNFVKARTTAQKNACIANLKQIDGATQQWALENRKSKDSPVRPEDIAQYLRNRTLPKCPQGGVYTLTTVGEDPKCSVPGHGL